MHLVSPTRKTVAEVPVARRTAAEPSGLAAWLLGKWQLWKKGARPVRRHMRVVEQLALGSQRPPLLLQIGGEPLLVRGGPGSVYTTEPVRPETRTGATPISLVEHC